MTDALALDHEDDHFRDIRRVVGHALEVFRNRADFNRATHGVRVLDHESDDFAEDLAVELIDLFVILADLESEARVLAHESVQAFAGHSLGDTGHARDIDIGFELWLLVKLQGSLAGVNGHVADPFEIGGDFQTRRDEAQILSCRLMQGEQTNAQIVDFHVQTIYFVVALDDDLRQLGIAVDQRFYSFLDLILDQPAHIENLLMELFQVFFVFLVGMFRFHGAPLSRIGQ